MKSSARATGHEGKDAEHGFASTSPLIGNRYKLHQTLGVGVQGTVRAATDIHTGEVVAFKLIPKEPFVRRWSTFMGASSRSRKEAKATKFKVSGSSLEQDGTDVPLAEVGEHHPAMEPIAREVAILARLRGHPNVVELKDVIWDATLHEGQDKATGSECDHAQDVERSCDVAAGAHSANSTAENGFMPMGGSDGKQSIDSSSLNHAVFRHARQATGSTAASKSSYNERHRAQRSDGGPGRVLSEGVTAVQVSSAEGDRHAIVAKEGTPVVAIVMELCGAGELFDLMFYGGALPEDLAFPLFAQLVSALQYSHSIGVCHRDVKPENLLFDRENMRLRLADFGLAAIYRDVSLAGDDVTQGFEPAIVGSEPVRDGKFNLLTWSVGTSFYMAPEVLAQRRRGHVNLDHGGGQADQDAHDAQVADAEYRKLAPEACREQGRYPFGYDAEPADVWSAGVVLFLMLTGSPPFHVADCSDWWFNELYHGRAKRFWKAHLRTVSLSRTAIALLTRMLDPRPECRPTLYQLCEHAFIRDLFGYGPSVNAHGMCPSSSWLTVSDTVMSHVRDSLIERREDAIAVKNQKLMKQRQAAQLDAFSQDTLLEEEEEEEEEGESDGYTADEREEEEMSKEVAEERAVTFATYSHGNNVAHDGVLLGRGGEGGTQQGHVESDFAHCDVDGSVHVLVMSMQVQDRFAQGLVHPSQRFGLGNNDVKHKLEDEGNEDEKGKSRKDTLDDWTGIDDNKRSGKSTMYCEEDSKQAEQQLSATGACNVSPPASEVALPTRSAYQWGSPDVLAMTAAFGVAVSVKEASQLLAQTLSVLAPGQWQQHRSSDRVLFTAKVVWKNGAEVGLNVHVAKHASLPDRCAIALKRVSGDALAFHDIVDTITTCRSGGSSSPSLSLLHPYYALSTVVDSVLL